MNRVVVTRPYYGSCHMQVCAVADATDNEIVEACNGANPSGTQNGWSVVRKPNGPADQAPVDCKDYVGRKHFILVC